MRASIRRGLIGLLAGLGASVLLAATLRDAVAAIVLGALIGAGYALVARPEAQGYADGLVTMAALGIPLWALVSVIAAPTLGG